MLLKSQTSAIKFVFFFIPNQSNSVTRQASPVLEMKVTTLASYRSSNGQFKLGTRLRNIVSSPVSLVFVPLISASV